MQLERKRKQLEARGYRVAALTYDSVEILSNFAERVDIGYPLLSDPGSKIIKSFGIFNESVPKDHRFYGIPHPGEYWIGTDGRVVEKHFEQNYADRFTAGRTLVRLGDAEAGPRATEIKTQHLTATTWASDEAVRGGNRIALVVDLELPEKMHVYSPEVEGYIPIDWQAEDVEGLTFFGVEYPEAEMLRLEAIKETVPVYEGRVRLIRDVRFAQQKELEHLIVDDAITVKGKLRYQACDDKVCYLPQTLDLEWKFNFEAHDRTRAE